nr:LysR family transcriptional regulator [Thalassotalea sp. Y01]
MLVALSVLLRERNISRAAQTLFVSQPAMSKTLARLRDTFNDDILYRTSQGMMPTERAKQIGRQLPVFLQQALSIVGEEEFSPSTIEQVFTLSIPPLIGQGCLLGLFTQVAQLAPSVVIEEHPPVSDPSVALETGEIDFAIHPNANFNEDFEVSLIGSADLSIYASKRHPLASKQATLGQCLGYGFVNLMVDKSARTSFVHPVDNLLNSLNVKRSIIFSSGQLSSVMEVLNSSNALFIGPRSLIASHSLKDHIAPVYHFNLTDEQKMKFYLIRHKRNEQSKVHNWFKTLLNDSLQGL